MAVVAAADTDVVVEVVATAALTAVHTAATATHLHVPEEATDIPVTGTSAEAPATAILPAVAEVDTVVPSLATAPLTEGSPTAENHTRVNHSAASLTDTVDSRAATTVMDAVNTEDMSHVKETDISATAAATATTDTREEVAQTVSAETATVASLATLAVKMSLPGADSPARHRLGVKDCARGPPPANFVEVGVDHSERRKTSTGKLSEISACNLPLHNFRSSPHFDSDHCCIIPALVR